jgi:hypothetical protein
MLESTITEINNSKSHSDNLKKVLAINSQIVASVKDVSLVSPNRKFVCESVLKKVDAGPGKHELRHCILFSDVLVYCKSKGMSY